MTMRRTRTDLGGGEEEGRAVFWDRFVGLIKPSFADVAAKEQDQRSFFLRMYGKLFVLTACVASTCPQRPGVAAFRTLTQGLVHTRNKVECCSRLIHRR